MLDLILSLTSFCINDALYFKLICGIDRTLPAVIQYKVSNPKDACYKDGIYYPQWKDLEEPLVWHYQKLLSNP